MAYAYRSGEVFYKLIVVKPRPDFSRVPPHLLLNAYNAATIGTTRAMATLAREQSEPNPDRDEEERSTR